MASQPHKIPAPCGLKSRAANPGTARRGSRVAILLAVVSACGGGARPAATAGEGASVDGAAGAGGNPIIEADGAGGAPADAGVAPAGHPSFAHWVMAYYAGYQSSELPVSDIPWQSLTHLALAFYLPRADGTLDESLSLDATSGPALARDVVQAAHANGRLAIASIGGAGLHDQFAAAAGTDMSATFVASLAALVSKYGFDGVDLDWEPIAATDQAPLAALVAAVRAALPKGAIITMPVGYENPNMPDDLSFYAGLTSGLDQINIMTYGMTGAFEGWKSWHSSALYQTDPSTPTSVDGSVKLYLAAGVPAAKLGVGAGFYGVCYTPPVTAPDQALGGATVRGDDGSLGFGTLSLIYDLTKALRDPVAHVPYLSFQSASGPDGCGYVSYEDATSLNDKAAYVESGKLGGVIVWTLAEGYLPTAAAGARNPLMSALGAALLP
jgi:chitinase